MTGKKCPMGHTELCDAGCAWSEQDKCAVLLIAESLMIKPKPARKRSSRKPKSKPAPKPKE